MAFWLIVLLVALIVLVILASALLRSDRQATAPGAFDVQVYRDQLNGLERDLERGTLAADEADRARTEISRRLLEADRAAQAAIADTKAPKSMTYAAITLTAVLLLGGGYGLYSRLGVNTPGQGNYDDMPLKSRIAAAADLRETRPDQAAAEAELPPWPGPPADVPADYLELVGRLRAAVAERPDDLQGNQLLATHEAALGNFTAAHQASARIIAAKGGTASADEYAQYADLLIQAAGGYVSPEAEDALTQSMNRNPSNPVARYYSGLMFAQIGRPDLGFRFWQTLLEEGPPDAPWIAPIRAQILPLAAMAGVDYALPEAPGPALAGPSAGDIANAGEMTEDERMQMIDGMVTRLSDRLADQGGTAAEWAQLIGALGVLGETQKATAIWAEAQIVFADSPDDLAVVRDAARTAGAVD